MDDSTARADSKLDEALEQTFPASDPLGNTVETGVLTGAVPPLPSRSVTDDRTRERFEVSVNGGTAFLVYERTHDALRLIHTEVPPSLRGHHLGEALAEAALQAARSEGLRIVAVCPFVKAYLRSHPPPA
jgi:predicted GNAT family acetyltransferase